MCIYNQNSTIKLLVRKITVSGGLAIHDDFTHWAYQALPNKGLFGWPCLNEFDIDCVKGFLSHFEHWKNDSQQLLAVHTYSNLSLFQAFSEKTHKANAKVKKKLHRYCASSIVCAACSIITVKNSLRERESNVITRLFSGECAKSACSATWMDFNKVFLSATKLVVAQKRRPCKQRWQAKITITWPRSFLLMKMSTQVTMRLTYHQTKKRPGKTKLVFFSVH